MKKTIKIVTFILSLISLVLLYIYINSMFIYKSEKEIKTKASNKIEDSKKIITFSYGGNDYGDSFNKNIESFKKSYPNIEIKIQQVPSSTDYRRNLYQNALYSGDDSFDVFFADIAWTNEFASSELVLSLDRYLTDEFKSEFIENTLNVCVYKNKIYAIPLRTDAPFLYYRTDLVKIPPKTYDELVKIAKENINKNGIKYGYVFQGYSYEGFLCNVLEFIWNNGGDIIENNKVVINSANSIEGLQLFIDIINSNITSMDVLSFQEDDSYMSFRDGSSVFMRNWPYAYTQLNLDTSKVKGNFDIAPLPIGPKGEESIGALGGWNFMINKNTKNPDEAWKFVKWMTSYDSQVWDSISGGGVPTRKDVYDNKIVKDNNPWLKILNPLLVKAKSRPFSKNYSTVSEILQDNFRKAVLREISATEAIEIIESELKSQEDLY